MKVTDSRVSQRAVLFKQRGKVKKFPHTWEKSQRPNSLGSLSSGFYKDFISWVKGSWLCFYAVGLFIGYISSSANVFHGDTVHALLSLLNGPEVWCTSQAIYQGMAHILLVCLSSFKAWKSGFKTLKSSYICLSCLCVPGKFPLSSPCPCSA
jgi:hypothetical protein